MKTKPSTSLLISISLWITFILHPCNLQAGTDEEEALVIVNYRTLSHPSVSLPILDQRFTILLKSSQDVIHEGSSVDEFGHAYFTTTFANVDKVVWERTLTDENTHVLWPAYVERTGAVNAIANPLTHFTLTRLEYITGPAKADLLNQIEIAPNYGRANEILQSLHHVYAENELLCRQIKLPWRSLLSQIIREAVDRAIDSRRLKPDGDMTSSNRIHSLLYLGGWLRWGNRWVGSAHMSKKDQKVHLGDMLARCVYYSTRCYLPATFGRANGGHWPALSAEEVRDELEPQLRPVFEADAIFLHETFVDSVSSAILSEMITESPSLSSADKALWQQLRYGTPDNSTPSLFLTQDPYSQTWGKMNLASLQKLVELTNRAAAAYR